MSSGLRGVGSRLAQRLRSQAQLDDEELQDASEKVGCTKISECRPGETVAVAGRVRSATVCPVRGLPQFEIEVYDGSGQVRVVWIGRRQIRGVSPGRHIRVRGRLMCNGQEPTLFNPEYEIFPLAASG